MVRHARNLEAVQVLRREIDRLLLVTAGVDAVVGPALALNFSKELTVDHPHPRIPRGQDGAVANPLHV